MKKKIFIGIGIFIVLLLAAIIILPIVYKGKLVEYVQNEANKQLNATLDFDPDIKLSLLRNFPNFTLRINDLSIVNHAPFEGDTLLTLKSFTASIDIMSVIRGDDLSLKTLDIYKPRIYISVLEDGTANWDIMKVDEDDPDIEDEPSDFKLNLQKYSFREGHLVYNDKSMALFVELINFNHSGSGDMTQEIVNLLTLTDAKYLNVAFDGVTYLQRINTELKAELEINVPDLMFNFKDNDLRLNDMHFMINGSAGMPDNVVVNLDIEATKTEFKNLISLIPALYYKDFDKIESSGTLSFRSYIRGEYTEDKMPGFGIMLHVNNGMFSYHELPARLEQFNMVMNFEAPDGDLDLAILMIDNMSFRINEDPFNLQLMMTRFASDPVVNMGLNGRLNFLNVSQLIHFEEGTKLAGILDVALQLNGQVSKLEQTDLQALNVNGSLLLNDFQYESNDLAENIEIPEMSMKFTPSFVSLEKLDMKMGKSDLRANGRMDNLFNYLLAGAVLEGSLSINSNLMDLNPWIADSETETEKAAENGTEISVVKLPADITFAMNSDIKELIFADMHLYDLKGQLLLHDQKLSLQNFNIRAFEGNFNADGFYSTADVLPSIGFDLNINNVSMQSVYQSFSMIREFAPIGQYVNGNFNSKMKLSSDLNLNMMPTLETVNSKGSVSIPKASIEGFKPIDKVADALRMEKLKKFEVSNININYSIENGRMFIEPFNFILDEMNFTVSGSNGIDQSIDYIMQLAIPSKYFNQYASAPLSSILGKDISVPEDRTFIMDIYITGTIDDPVVETDLQDIVAGMGRDLEDALKRELDKQRKELEQRVRQEADKVKEEAEKLKREGEEKLKQETDKLKEDAEKAKREAEKRAEEEKERLKREAEERAKERLKDLRRP